MPKFRTQNKYFLHEFISSESVDNIDNVLHDRLLFHVPDLNHLHVVVKRWILTTRSRALSIEDTSSALNPAFGVKLILENVFGGK